MDAGRTSLATSEQDPSKGSLPMILEDRREVDRDIEETLGLVPEFFRRVPDYLLPTEWASFKSLELSDATAIPNKYKELMASLSLVRPGADTAPTSTQRRRACSVPPTTRSLRLR
jgi:hypothetical protein